MRMLSSQGLAYVWTEKTYIRDERYAHGYRPWVLTAHTVSICTINVSNVKCVCFG